MPRAQEEPALPHYPEALRRQSRRELVKPESLLVVFQLVQDEDQQIEVTHPFLGPKAETEMVDSGADNVEAKEMGSSE